MDQLIQKVTQLIESAWDIYPSADLINLKIPLAEWNDLRAYWLKKTGIIWEANIGRPNFKFSNDAFLVAGDRYEASPYYKSDVVP